MPINCVHWIGTGLEPNQKIKKIENMESETDLNLCLETRVMGPDGLS